MRKAIFIGAMLLALLPALQAQACAVNRPANVRLEQAYAQDVIIGRAIVVVQSAEHIAPPVPDLHPFTVTARAVRRETGAGLPAQVTFEGGWGSAACDLGFAIPAAGDRWVIYFWRDNTGFARVWEAYPLDVAIAADPRGKWLLKQP